MSCSHLCTKQKEKVKEGRGKKLQGISDTFIRYFLLPQPVLASI